MKCELRLPPIRQVFEPEREGDGGGSVQPRSAPGKNPGMDTLGLGFPSGPYFASHSTQASGYPQSPRSWSPNRFHTPTTQARYTSHFKMGPRPGFSSFSLLYAHKQNQWSLPPPDDLRGFACCWLHLSSITYLWCVPVSLPLIDHDFTWGRWLFLSHLSPGHGTMCTRLVPND